MGRHVTKANITGIQKRRKPSKHYVYIIQVEWSTGERGTIYRRYNEFFEFQSAMLDTFPDVGKVANGNRLLPFLPGKKLIGRSAIREVAEERENQLDAYLSKLIKLPSQYIESDLMVTFFSANDDDRNPPENAKTRPISGEYAARHGITPAPASPASSARVEKQKKVFEQNSDSGDLELQARPSATPKPAAQARPPPPKASNAAPVTMERFVTGAAYEAQGEGEITFAEGVIVDEVLEKSPNGWWMIRCGGAEGWAPSNYLDPYRPTPAGPSRPPAPSAAASAPSPTPAAASNPGRPPRPSVPSTVGNSSGPARPPRPSAPAVNAASSASASSAAPPRPAQPVSAKVNTFEKPAAAPKPASAPRPAARPAPPAGGSSIKANPFMQADKK